MAGDLKDFWSRFQTGVDVAVAGEAPDKLLGVRDAFVRYFREGLEKPLPVAVIPHRLDESKAPLPLSDADILALARSRARDLARRHGEVFAFYVGSEAGLLLFEAAGQRRYFVRTWTTVLGLGEEAWGSSGSVQLPERLIDGLDQSDLPFAIPGTRRSGGMVSSLTGGLDTRRRATEVATLNALATLLYGRLEARPRRRYQPR